MSSDIKWDQEKELSEWKQVAMEKQKIYHEFFKNRRWEHYEMSEFPYLQAKIGYIFYGPPIISHETPIENCYSNYTSVQKKKIECILTAIKKIIKNSNSAIVGFIFLIAMINKEYTEFPAFRVLTKKQADIIEDYEIIDSFGYIYRSWEKFLATNILPYGVYCYPKNSFYSCRKDGEVEVDFSIFTKGYSILSGIASRVKPFGRRSSIDFRFIPCKSIIKGVKGRNKNYWIPVTTASGSADIYAVHSTYSLALSCQRIYNVPQLILEALKHGFINLNWYSIINNIENIVQNSNLISSRHIAEVISSALFFCNTVLSPELAKQIIKEIKNNKSHEAYIYLDTMQKSFLEKSLMFKEKFSSTSRTIHLKFLYNRNSLLDEIIENNFKTDFMIPDQYGNYYMLGKLLENLGSSHDTKKYSDIITNYCLVLEEIIRKCDNCSQIIEGNRSFIETLHYKANNIMVKERDIKLNKRGSLSSAPRTEEASSKLHNQSANSCEESFSPQHNTNIKKHWNRYTLYPNSQDAKESISPNIHQKEMSQYPKSTLTNAQDISKLRDRSCSDEEFSLIPTPLGSYREQSATENLGVQSNSQSKFNFQINTIDEMTSRGFSSPISKCSDLNENINTPDSKAYNKKCIVDDEIFKKNQQPRKAWASVRMVDFNEEAAENKNLPKEEVQSGKFEIFTRQIIDNKKLEPLDYYYKFVEDEFKSCKPTVHNDQGEENSWVFINEKETSGVKLIKIDIRARDKDKEWVGVTYY